MADAPVPGAATPDVVAPEASATATVVPTPDLALANAAATGAATASTAAAGAATVSSSAPEVPTPVPDVPSPSAQPAAEEELEDVSGRRPLQGLPEEEAAPPLLRVLVQVRRSIEEATSSAEVAFQLEWAALESEHQRLFDWHTRLEAHAEAEASHAVETRSKLKADQEAYRANLQKVFGREFSILSREKALAQREETFA
jgi:hypothetical protein